MKIALCKKAESIPENGYLFERKFDGARALGIDGEIYNRDEDHAGRKITEKFPEIEVPEGAVIDGEIISSAGFGSVVGRQNDSKDFSIRMKAKSCPATFMAFDLLAKEDTDFRKEPLMKRKAELSRVLENGETENVELVRYSPNGEKMWEKVTENGWEGLVSKKLHSPYPKGRSSDWLKIKNWEEDVFPIVDWEKTEDEGFVVLIPVEDGTQRIVVNNKKAQERIRNSDEDLKAEIRYLEKNDEERLRHIAFKRAIRR